MAGSPNRPTKFGRRCSSAPAPDPVSLGDHIAELTARAEEHGYAVDRAFYDHPKIDTDHVWSCDRYGLIVFAMKPDEPFTPPTYFAALHEFAHAFIDDPLRRAESIAAEGDFADVASEAEAWAWALREARIAPTPEMWSRIKHRLGEYIDAARAAL